MKKRKTSYFLLPITIILFLVNNSFAQLPNAPVDNSKSGKDSVVSRAIPAIGKVIGILRDSSTKEVIEFASVALLRIRDSSAVAGSLTDGKGHFTIEEVPIGKYILRISSIGYRKMDSKPFLLIPSEPLKDFGTVYVPSSIKKLKELEISADKVDYVNSIDKKVYNADKDLTSVGGTASDLLKNVPSVNVDVDGKVSLRGNDNVTILIDGKPSGLGGGDKTALLQQLPANTIDQIEVITNPSARYDAEGMAGIINIKTKKDKRSGMNGTITAGVGTNDKYNTGFTLNNRTKKTNLFAQYTFRDESRTQSGESHRFNNYTIPESIYSSYTSGKQYNESHNAKLGIDFFLNDYNTLTTSGGYTNRFENKPETVLYTFDTLLGTLSPNVIRENSSTEKSHGGEGNIEFRHLFPGTKREFSSSLNYSVNDRNEDEEYVSKVADAVTVKHRSITDGKYTVGNFQSDYIHPINDKTKFEAGIKAAFRRNDNDIIGALTDSLKTYIPDPIYTDHFIYEDQIYAGYSQFSGRVSKFDYIVGLRVEQTVIVGKSETNSKDFKKNYLDFFPSATVKYTLKEVNELQLSYSRRVNRPGQQQLNPFTDYADSLNVRRGNPQLNPEYISSFEFGYFRRFNEQSIGATLYYRKTNNLITRYRTLDTLVGITTTTFQNFSSSSNTGFEIIMRNQLVKTVSATTSFNLFQNKIDGSNVDAELQSNNTNWNIRTSISWKVKPTTSFQVTGNYMSPNKSPQGSFKGMSGVDVGFRQELLKGKFTFSANVTDIFNTRKIQIHNEGKGFVLDQIRKRESRIANFTLVYRFGKADVSLFGKKRPTKSDLPQQDYNNGDF